ncbi:hypothetical protein ANO11243_091420 [Dothideomycetidae sp. 11243]|nr:hypothetical protein ANO11243_091420 [fungal sp. No.11243]
MANTQAEGHPAAGHTNPRHDEAERSPAQIHGRQRFPVTVSAPDIHYTSTEPAVAIIDPDSIFFIAYNKTYEKRILHPLKYSYGLSLSQERLLYQDTSFASPSTTTILDLLLEKFGDDAASLHLVSSASWFQDYPRLAAEVDELHRDLFDLAGELPTIPLNVGVWNMPEPRPNLPPGPRLIVVTDGQPQYGPLFIDDISVKIQKADVEFVTNRDAS